MNSFIKLFETVVKDQPHKPAIVINGNSAFSYNDIYKKAHTLSIKLKSKNVRKGKLVALFMEKSLEYFVSLLAVWMTEGGFVLIDPKLPKYRQNQILKATKPICVVSQDLSIKLKRQTTTYDENLAYIMFTSGSTGKPKGVMISQKGITNVLLQQIDVFKLKPGNNMFLFLSINFDASLSDIGTTLLSGATLHIETENELDFAKNLPNIIKQNHITHIDLPPSLLPIIDPSKLFKSLETIIIGGEVCSEEVIRKWAKFFRIINCYGPTEATICTSMKICKHNWIESNIGSPIKNIEYQVVDNNLNPLPGMSKGELLIAGKGLALGYVQDIKLTKKKFVNIRGKRFYCTGDLVKKISENEFLFIGRQDRQIKIYGKLVAPEEIETTILSHPSVTRVIVTYQNSILFAIVESKTLTKINLKIYLKKKLPLWMIPHHTVIQKKIALTTNGKIDMNQVNKILSRKFHVSKSKISSSFPLKKTLQLIWKNTLNLKNSPSITAHFFEDLGGDSLKAVEMITTAHSKNIDLPLSLIYELGTIENLLLFLKHKNDIKSFDSMPAHFAQKTLKKLKASKNLPSAPEKKILITGSTGFLGIHILYELLHTTTNSITCLIRAKNKSEAFLRLKTLAERYKININFDKVEVIIGDLKQNNFGITQSLWNTLCCSISSIYHCAAEVNMLKSYEQLKQVNVDGTIQITKFASTYTLKEIHYMSTLSVFVSTNKNIGLIKESDKLDLTSTIYGGYAQTKWVSEYYLSLQNHLNINIFRIGLILGHSQKPNFSDKDYLNKFVKGLIQQNPIKNINALNLYLDVTPVDYAAKAIAYISQKNIFQCYHIVNRKGFSLQMILDNLYKRNIKVNQNDGSRCNYALTKMALCRLAVSNVDYFKFRTMDLFQATNIVFDCRNTKKVLKGSGIKCPRATQKLLNEYLDRYFNE